MHPDPILNTDAKIGEKIDCQYAYTTGHTGSMPEDLTSSLLFARQSFISSPNEAFQRTENPADIQQPAPHVIDYWFDRLGLSVNPISSENPSNATSSPFQFPMFDGTIYSAAGTTNIETSAPEYCSVSNDESPKTSVPLPSATNQVKHSRVQPSGVAHHQLRISCERQRSFRNVYDQPGKKPAAEYEPDFIKLEALCRVRGGTEFACQWIPRVFKGGVTLGALLRRLKLTEIESMHFRGGFKPSLAYDGFLQIAEGGFECCLCTVGKWKNKKDAVRHLRKFHFGLADQCITCHKSVYSTGEMNSHRCAPPQNLVPLATTMEPGASSDSPIDSSRN